MEVFKPEKQRFLGSADKDGGEFRNIKPVQTLCAGKRGFWSTLELYPQESLLSDSLFHGKPSEIYRHTGVGEKLFSRDGDGEIPFFGVIERDLQVIGFSSLHFQPISEPASSDVKYAVSFRELEDYGRDRVLQNGKGYIRIDSQSVIFDRDMAERISIDLGRALYCLRQLSSPLDADEIRRREQGEDMGLTGPFRDFHLLGIGHFYFDFREGNVKVETGYRGARNRKRQGSRTLFQVGF